MKWLRASVLLCLIAAGCQRTGSPPAEPPPPPIETDLDVSAGLVDPRAEAILRQMSERLARATAFALEADEQYDEVPAHSPRKQLTSRRYIAVRRPDHVVADASGDALNRSLWYDGQTFSAFDKEQQVWASGAVPPTIDEALDWVIDQTGTVVPVADFIYSNPYERLMASVQRGAYLGIHEAAGVPCHHVSLEQATIDWQIWIDAGADPVPRKLVIAYKTEDEVPQYSVTIRKWNLDAHLPDALFGFIPPEHATRVEVRAAMGVDSENAAGGRR